MLVTVGSKVRQGVAALVMASALVASASLAVRAQDDLSALNAQVVELYREGKYAQAIGIAERALSVAERLHGAKHIDSGQWLNTLASLYDAQGRHSEAEALYRRALAIAEPALGPNHPNVGTILYNQAELYRAVGRYAEAEPLLQRALDIAENALEPDHPTVGTRLNSLAQLFQAQGRYSEAEPLFKRVLDTRKRTLGEEHTDTLVSANNLAVLYKSQGRYTEAEGLHRRALEAQERLLGREHPDTLTTVNNLAGLHADQGRYHEAEPLYRRAVEALERVLGTEHPTTLISVNNLAALYHEQGRYDAAERLHGRVLEARQRMLGWEHPATLASANNLASAYDHQGRYQEAEALYKRVVEATERVLGKEHPETFARLNNLALLYKYQGRYDEAEPLYKRALQGQERVLGKEHPATLRTIVNLGALYQAEGRTGDGAPLLEQAWQVSERLLGAQHPLTLDCANNLAWLHFVQGDWARAARLWRRWTAATIQRAQHSAHNIGRAQTGKGRSLEEQSGWQFRGLIKAVSHLVPEGFGLGETDLSEAFQTAQWALSSEAAHALAQMAARAAKGSPALATLVRERQDLVAEWQRRDILRNAALAQRASERNPKGEAENLARFAAIDAQLAEIDRRLAVEFPDYAALANPIPLSVEEVQASLATDEALVLFLDTPELQPVPEETFIWIITKAKSRWVRSKLGTPSLTREVAALRCGLDATAWQMAGPWCTRALGRDGAPAQGEPLPFDHRRAHGLYKALFGEIEDLIAGKHLLVVPSGPLTQLPFQVLVTEPPTSADHRTIAWLPRPHPVTVLPSVSSLKALRRMAKTSAATRPMIGFGNPLLDGPDQRYGEQARLARAQWRCQQTASQRLPSPTARGGVSPFALQAGLADPSHLKAQVPLPETVDELCTVAASVAADLDDIRLGARATEGEIKALSASGTLAQYRIVHFATHGALAGELSGTSEPGLILTPPAAATPEDDGFLSASEIAGLKLDADWVVLSACNTAAGDSATAEALSGLARAFFYAQARSLLVSHWAVDSLATVKLITSSIAETARNRNIGRAEALRRAMLALIDHGAPREAHPAIWAPFVVVGEGASASALGR